MFTNYTNTLTPDEKRAARALNVTAADVYRDGWNCYGTVYGLYNDYYYTTMTISGYTRAEIYRELLRALIRKMGYELEALLTYYDARRDYAARERRRDRYEAEKERARQAAIDCQNSLDGRNYSYGELAEMQDRLEKLGRRYGLLEEFRENGII